MRMFQKTNFSDRTILVLYSTRNIPDALNISNRAVLSIKDDIEDQLRKYEFDVILEENLEGCYFYWSTGIEVNYWGGIWRIVSGFSSFHSGETSGNTGISACDFYFILISKREFGNENWNQPDFAGAFYWTPSLFKIPSFLPNTWDMRTKVDKFLYNYFANFAPLRESTYFNISIFLCALNPLFVRSR